MNKPIIFTIGHSIHPLEFFLELLKTYNINCIIDVRTVPASKYNPQFNQDILKAFLNQNKITYLHFAEEFGARKSDPDLLDNEGILDFDKVRNSKIFRNGLERIWQGVEKGFVIALMCSESEPIECHRFSLISLALIKNGFEVHHILKDKSIKTNSEVEKELIKKFRKKLPERNLFEPDITEADQLKHAYKLINKKIGYSPYKILKEDDND